MMRRADQRLTAFNRGMKAAAAVLDARRVGSFRHRTLLRFGSSSLEFGKCSIVHLVHDVAKVFKKWVDVLDI
jgi:hypothetical protein